MKFMGFLTWAFTAPLRAFTTPADPHTAKGTGSSCCLESLRDKMLAPLPASLHQVAHDAARKISEVLEEVFIAATHDGRSFVVTQCPSAYKIQIMA